jgi:Ca2+-binding EF-hand superfamily protein
MSMSVAAIGGSGGLQAMSGASTGMPPQQKMTSLYNQIDTNGAGSITQQQFTQAFQTLNPPPVFQQQGAGAIFAALDPNSTGTVSKQDFISGMTGLMASLRAEGGSNISSPSPSQTLASSLRSLNSVDSSSIPINAEPGSFVSTTA